MNDSDREYHDLTDTEIMLEFCYGETERGQDSNFHKLRENTKAKIMHWGFENWKYKPKNWGFHTWEMIAKMTSKFMIKNEIAFSRDFFVEHAHHSKKEIAKIRKLQKQYLDEILNVLKEDFDIKIDKE